jgi:hypothetical protein
VQLHLQECDAQKDWGMSTSTLNPQQGEDKNMGKRNAAAASLMVLAGIVAGCGGAGSSGSPTSTTPSSALTAVSGKVADGYLVNATVFLDQNNNYQLDAGEPSAVTDANGAYTLNISADDLGKYPIVVLAVKGQTIDLDNPGSTIINSYVMSLPPAAVSGTISAMVSPMSTLIRENMAANPGMSLSDAMTQLRNQMNLPSGTDMMADYVKLAASSDANKASYQLMHTAAQDMAALMAGQASQIMAGPGGATSVDVNRFRTMMGEMNLKMPQMVDAMKAGVTQNQTMLGQMASTLGSMMGSVPPTLSGMPFRNMTSMFPSMSGIRFWNMTGHPIASLPGMMGGKGSSSIGNMMGKIAAR